MYSATGTACSLRHNSFSTSCSSRPSLPRIPGLYPNFLRTQAQGSSKLRLTSLQRASRTPLSLPSLVPSHRGIAHKLRSVNEPYVTQSTNDEPEVSFNGSTAAHLHEDGSHLEVEHASIFFKFENFSFCFWFASDLSPGFCFESNLGW